MIFWSESHLKHFLNCLFHVLNMSYDLMIEFWLCWTFGHNSFVGIFRYVQSTANRQASCCRTHEKNKRSVWNVLKEETNCVNQSKVNVSCIIVLSLIILCLFNAFWTVSWFVLFCVGFLFSDVVEYVQTKSKVLW